MPEPVPEKRNRLVELLTAVIVFPLTLFAIAGFAGGPIIGLLVPIAATVLGPETARQVIVLPTYVYVAWVSMEASAVYIYGYEVLNRDGHVPTPVRYGALCLAAVAAIGGAMWVVGAHLLTSIQRPDDPVGVVGSIVLVLGVVAFLLYNVRAALEGYRSTAEAGNGA